MEAVPKRSIECYDPVKKHNAVNYHKSRESIASGAVRVAKEPGETSLSDICTKLLVGPRTKRALSSHVLLH